MKWGLIPAWHKGDPYKLQYETNNCRAEGMLTKKTYKGPLEKGNRCIILAEGFFEWKRTEKGKQPYFIYFPQSAEDTKPDVKPDTKLDIKTEPIKPDPDAKSLSETKPKLGPACVKPEPNGDNEPIAASSSEEATKREVKQEIKSEPDEAGEKTGNGDAQDEEQEWKGRRLLTMAGVFGVWHPSDGTAPLYSYSVITVDSSPAMSSIHHRMPAILSSEEEIRDWLDFGEVPLTEAVKAIHATECIKMHMVSPVVNNSRNKSPECLEPYNPKEVKKTASSNLMMNWLSKAKPSPDKQQPDAKKPKLG
ncbi:abasic site processing protein HMCES-like isoform X2 [Littorina saxatilis]